MTQPVPALQKLNDLTSAIMARLRADLPAHVARINAAKTEVERAEEALRVAKTEGATTAYAWRELRKNGRDMWRAAGFAFARAARFALLLAAYYCWTRESYALAIVLALAFVAQEYEQRKEFVEEAKEIAAAEGKRLEALAATAQVELSNRIEDLVLLTTAIANEHEAKLKELRQAG